MLLIAVIWSIRRRPNVVLRVHNTAGIEQLLPSVAGLSLGDALSGNSVELLEHGSYFDVLLARIGAARHSVHFETFLWKEGSIGRRLGEALAKQSRSGFQVRVLLDANGSRHIGSATLARMREGGCQVVFFHDGAFRNIGLLDDRDHRKLVVIDGREAFVGGHCIVDSWLGDAEDHQHYADVSVRIQGPIIKILQGAFSENWIGESAEVFSRDAYFPRVPEGAAKIWMHAAYLKPEGSPPAVKILHHTAICLARERIWMQNPYFIPQPAVIDTFADAVRRGVDVRVLMPSTSGSDNPMVQHAGHRNFEKLLRCGVPHDGFERQAVESIALNAFRLQFPRDVKTAIIGSCHAFDFAKYAHRYLAEFQYRFNRHFNMKTILPRLLTALVVAAPSSERVLRAAEVSRQSGAFM